MFGSGPTTPGVGGSLGFLNLPDLPTSGLGTGGRDESTLSESLNKGSYAMGKQGQAVKKGGPALTTNTDEIDEFDFLMQESFERKQKYAQSALGGNATKSRQKVIEEPHQTTEFDVDDLIKELSGEESWRKKV